MIGNDFVPEASKKAKRCSECDKRIPANQVALVSKRNGRIRKRICSDDCRLEFDARFWAVAARTNKNKRRSK